jgi:hypothetical protein
MVDSPCQGDRLTGKSTFTLTGESSFIKPPTQRRGPSYLAESAVDIKKREKERGLQFVDGVARQPVPNQAPQPTGAAVSVSPNSTPPEAAPAAEL